MKPYMSKDEIRRRRKDGASLTTLAELNGCKPEDIKELIQEDTPQPLGAGLTSDLLNPAIPTAVIAKHYGLTQRQIYDKRYALKRAGGKAKPAKPAKQGPAKPRAAAEAPKTEATKTDLIKCNPRSSGERQQQAQAAEQLAVTPPTVAIKSPLPKPLPRAEWLEQRELALAAWLMWQIGQRQPLDRELLAELEAMQETSGGEHDAG